MARIRFLPLPIALIAVLLLSFGLSTGQAGAEPEDGKGKKAAPSGPTFQSKRLGLRASGPAGWKMVADKAGGSSNWKRLATFNDPKTDGQVVLYTRPRNSRGLDSFMAAVRKEWNKTSSRLRMDGMRKIDASGVSPIARVIVDGSFSRKGKTKKMGKDGVPPPPTPSTPMKVQATYYLGAGHEFLLYAQARQTHWSRLRKGLAKMRDELTLAEKTTGTPKGEGSYRNERSDFSCRFPKGYTVIQPQRTNHLVKFVGLSGDDPAFSIYAFPWEESAAADADRLVIFYEQDKGGEASTSRTEVSGTEGIRVKAKAMLDGVDRTIFIAVFKRNTTCYRVRCVVPSEEESKGAAAFQAFLDAFRFGN
jgi:hypothetical protein